MSTSVSANGQVKRAEAGIWTRLFSDTIPSDSARFLAWTVGLLQLLDGLVMLMLPAQFSASRYDSIRPYLPVLGLVLLSTGLLLLSWQLLQPFRRWLPRCSLLLAAMALMPFLQAMARVQVWTLVVTYGALIGALLVAAFEPAWLGRKWIDGTSVAVAVERTTLGLLLLLAPGLFAAPVKDAIRAHYSAWGLSMLVGAALLAAAIGRGCGPKARVLHLCAAALMAAWTYAAWIRAGSLIEGATSGLLAVAILARPFVPATWLQAPARRLLTKLVAGSAFFIGAALLVLTLGVLHQSDAAYRASAEQSLATAAQFVSRSSDVFAATQLQQAVLLSQLPAVQSLDPARQLPFIRSVGAGESRVDLALIADASGRTVLSSSANDPRPDSAAPDPGVLRVIATGQPGWEFVDSPQLRAPALAFRAPIVGPSGSIVGVYTDLVSLQSVSRQLAGAPVAHGSRVLIVDSQGKLIAQPGADFAPARADLSAQAPLTALRAGNMTPIVYRDANRLWLSAQARSPETGWTVLAQQPEALATAPSTRVRERSLGFFVLIVIASVTALTLFSHATSRPLVGLATAAAALGAGDLKARLPVATSDEIGDLVRAFADMRERLAAWMRAQAEAVSALERSEHRARLILENASDGVVLLDDVARITYASPPVARLLGHPAEELLGRSGFELLAPDDREPMMSGFAPLVRTPGRVQTSICRVQTAAGALRWVEATSRNLLHDAVVNAIVTNFRDITDRMAAEAERERLLANTQAAHAEAQAERERLATLLQTASVPIIVTDADGTIQLTNPAAQQAFALSQEEVIGRPYGEVLRLSPGAPGPLAQAIASKTRIAGLRRDLVDATGRSRTYALSVAPILGPDEAVLGAIEVLLDVTDRVEAQRVLSERTRALEAKTAEQDTFLYTVSHDLKAPLVSIRGMAELLAEDAADHLTDDDRYYISRIVDNAQRLAALLDDLLTLSRIGRTESERSVVDLQSAVTGALRSLTLQIEQRQARVTVEGELPDVWGDQGRVSEIFMNLIDNAIKYTPSGRTPEIRIGARRVQDQVEGWVADNGIGIPSEQRERVFGLFQRLADGKRLHTEGTGVGLAIVARIVAMQGGRIWIDERLRGGSIFRFSLPAPGAGEGERVDGDGTGADSTCGRQPGPRLHHSSSAAGRA